MRQKFSSLFKGNGRSIAFLSGQAISLFGSMMVQYALTWHLAIDSNSNWVFAIAIVCGMLPQMTVALISGVWADRYSRKTLIILADAGIALATLGLFFIVKGGIEGYAPFFVIMAIRSLGSGVQTPAVSALIPQLVPEDKLMRFNSINGMIQSMVMLLSPIAGAAVLASSPLTTVLLIDVATAALAIGILLPIRVPALVRTLGNASVGALNDFKTGLRYVREHFFVKRLSLYYIISSIFLVPAAAFNVLFVTRAYQGAYMNADTLSRLGAWVARFFDAQEGYLYLFLMSNEAAFFAGSIAGGILLAAMGGFKNRLMTLSLGCVTFGVMTCLMGFAPAFYVYLILMVFTGITMPMFNTPVMVLLQEKVEGDMLGRVFGLIQIVPQFAMMLTSLLIGILGERFSLGAFMSVFGFLMAIGGVLMLFDRRFMKEGLKKVAENG